MALDATKFFTNFGGGRQIHSYDGTADTGATMAGSGYFNLITNRLHKGDVILCVGATNTTMDQLFVTSASGAATVTCVIGT